MLKIIKNLGQLHFSELMQLYKESNAVEGSERHPDLSVPEQQHEAEQEFYQYLHTVFFHQEYARYVIWEEKGRYVSALRLESYKDGLLLCALETAPEFRRQGYAEKLLNALKSFLEQSSNGKLYSHISKKNTASLALHRKCGFKIVNDYSVHLDGSVFRDSVTMLCEYKKTES